MSPTLLRRLGIFVLLLPVLLAIPLYYWAFNYAGTWYVSTRLEPEHRAIHLHEANFLTLAMIFGLTCFPGLLLLFRGDYRRRLWLLIASAILFLPGLLLLAVFIECYIKFSR